MIRLVAGWAFDASHGLQPELRNLARRALAASSGSETDLSRIASGFNALRANLRRGLDPLVGAVATEALFDRSVRLSAEQFGWLPGVLPKNIAGTRRELTIDAAVLPPAPEFADGLASALAHTVAILTDFLGEDLIRPIVERAWAVNAVKPRK